MLNNDVLAQLRQLKQSIHDSKDRAEGTVKGSQGRFGFVMLDDGREIYLPPEQMQRVFPDDRIAIEVVASSDGKSAKDGKPTAQLERLLESPLRTFTGRYVVRDNAHFVEPDLPRLSRWIFVPPKLRRNAQHGNTSEPASAQHPFKDGKPQARIDASHRQRNPERHRGALRTRTFRPARQRTDINRKRSRTARHAIAPRSHRAAAHHHRRRRDARYG